MSRGVKEYLTFEVCRRMLGKRKFRVVSQCARLYPSPDGKLFLVKGTSWRRGRYDKNKQRWIPGTEKEVYEPPLAVIYPHNVAVLDDTAGEEFGIISAHNLFYKMFGIRSFSRSDKRSNVRFWWYNDRDRGRYGRADAKPFANGMQLDIISCEAIAGTPEEKRRLVDLQKAKPLRDQIAAWDKFACTYFALLDAWTPRHAKLLTDVRKMRLDFPALGDETSEVGLFQVILKGAPNYWWRFESNYYLSRSSEELAKLLSGKWRTAFEKWKEHIYATHDAYNWVDKKAT